MREILFRAKAINRIKGREYRTSYKNGDWVYGLVTEMYDDRFPNLPATMRNTDGVSNIDVDYKSIGQYTGLDDKKGKKIFEGDIVAYFINIDKATNKEFHEVVFETKGESGYFGIKVSNIGTFGFCPEVPAKLMEVIGNIHDNPELLEV